MDEKPKGKRGFASMSQEKRSEIASKGGKSVPAEKRTFSRNRVLAAAAGKRGGTAVPSEKRAFSVNRGLAQSAGKAGGTASHAKAEASNS